MTIDLLSMMNDDDLENEFGQALDVLTDIEIEKGFSRTLNEDNASVLDIIDNAPWNQLENESNLQYDAFKYYVNLSVDEWDPTDIQKFIDVPKTEITAWSKQFEWGERRLAYMKYREWLRRKQDEISHQHNIGDFRDTQSNLLKQASGATLTLIGKLSERIQTLDPNEIKAPDIPKFVSAVSQFVDITTEAQAKFLAINELLALYEDEIDSKAVRDHINYSKQSEVKPSNA